MDQGQGRAGAAAARAREASRAPRQVAAGAAGGAADDVRARSRSVAAVGLRQQPVRRGRAGGAPARDEAGRGGAGHGVLVGLLLGAAGDPDAGPGEGAQVPRPGAEARALPRVPGGDAAPQAAHAGRRRGARGRRGGRAGARRRRGARRALQRRSAVPDHQAVDRRVGAPRRRPRSRCTGRRATAPIATRCSRRSSARSRPTSARWAPRWRRR